jgi:uncharacterized protein YneF (UPF0154 family)
MFKHYIYIQYMLPFDIWYHIFHLLDGDLLSQLRIKTLYKEICVLHVTDLFNIEYKYKMNLTDNILVNFRNVKLLYTSCNPKITDEGIKHMMLHILHAFCNSKITDEGIKHMMLHTLHASWNPKIKDEGIKHMMLHTLHASWNPKITDEGIKHMMLYTLNAALNSNITYQIRYGVKSIK